jgi:hypothetical protein
MYSKSLEIDIRVHGDREPPRCGGVLQQRCQYLAGTGQVRGDAGNARQTLDIRTRILGSDGIGVQKSRSQGTRTFVPREPITCLNLQGICEIDSFRTISCGSEFLFFWTFGSQG